VWVAYLESKLISWSSIASSSSNTFRCYNSSLIRSGDILPRFLKVNLVISLCVDSKRWIFNRIFDITLKSNRIDQKTKLIWVNIFWWISVSPLLLNSPNNNPFIILSIGALPLRLPNNSSLFRIAPRLLNHFGNSILSQGTCQISILSIRRCFLNSLITQFNLFCFYCEFGWKFLWQFHWSLNLISLIEILLLFWCEIKHTWQLLTAFGIWSWLVSLSRIS